MSSKVLTFVFTDLKGSASLKVAKGDEAAGESFKGKKTKPFRGEHKADMELDFVACGLEIRGSIGSNGTIRPRRTIGFLRSY